MLDTISTIHYPGLQMMEKNRDPTRYVLILSTWRSGSTFLGELLTQFHETYYSYEPIHYLNTQVRKNI